MAACGGAPTPEAVVDPVVAAPPPTPRGAAADRLWPETRDDWLATQRAAVAPDDVQYTDFACDDTHVGTVIVGTCLKTLDHAPQDYAVWIVADEGALALSLHDLHIVRSRDDDGAITRPQVVAPVLSGDPSGGVRALRRSGHLLGVVALDGDGLHFVRTSAAARFADTVCGPAISMGGTMSLDAHVETTFGIDGSVRPRGACEDALEAILASARTGLQELDTLLGAAAMPSRAFAAAPEAEPTCTMPSRAQLARAQRSVLRVVAAWERDAAAERRERERDEEPYDGDAGDDSWGEQSAPPITAASLRRAFASARAGCVDPATSAFLLELSAPDVRYAGLWRVTPNDADLAELFETRGGAGGGNYERIASVLDADLTGDGVAELVVLLEATAVTDQSTGEQCDIAVSTYSPSSSAPLSTEQAGCEPSGNLSLPYAVLTPIAGDPHAAT